MFEDITPEHSAALDVIIRARHSVRAFSSTPPSQEAIEAIIQAGLLAPFGALAVAGKSDFRHQPGKGLSVLFILLANRTYKG